MLQDVKKLTPSFMGALTNVQEICTIGQYIATKDNNEN